MINTEYLDSLPDEELIKLAESSHILFLQQKSECDDFIFDVVQEQNKISVIINGCGLNHSFNYHRRIKIHGS